MEYGMSMGVAMDQQTMGAGVVSKTLDYMNNTGSSGFAPVDQQTFGAAVVSKTLDYMNSGAMGGSYGMNDGGMSQTYNFSQDVLGAYAMGKGAITNMMI